MIIVVKCEWFYTYIYGDDFPEAGDYSHDFHGYTILIMMKMVKINGKEDDGDATKVTMKMHHR